jgi:transposase, IS4 family
MENKHHNTPSTGVMVDQAIKFTGVGTKKRYPDALRRIVFYDTEDNGTFVFYTNNMALY